MTSVIVLVGAGSIGQAIARRVGAGKHILLGDLRKENADAAAKTLSDAGFDVSTAAMDVSSRDSVEGLVQRATLLGEVVGLIQAFGVSPTQAPPETILKVDLYGTALLLEEFGKVIARRGSGVVIASQSGHRLPPLSIEQNEALATTPVEKLLRLPFLQPAEVKDSLHAYQLAKRGNSLRVMAEAVRWGKRGARINTISPGIIITPLAKDELTGPRGPGYRRMIELSAAGRAGTPDEVGTVAALLMGTGWCLHHRQRLPDGWRRHLGFLVRRPETEMTKERHGMRIGILGSGLMGAKLGTLFARAGHEVVFSCARSMEKLKRLAKDAGPDASAGTPAEAAAGADALLLAVHWLRMDHVLRQAGNLSGKVILTCSLPMDEGDTGLVIGTTNSGAEQLARKVPKAKVVCAFNTVPSEVLFGVYEAQRKANRPSLAYCGDDPPSKKTAAGLIRDVGFDPVDAGPLRIARYTEPFALLMGQLAYEGSGGPEIAYRFERFNS